MKPPALCANLALAILACRLLLNTEATAQEPVFEARFNDPGTVELRNGGTLGPEGSGVSGKPKDFCFVADLSDYQGGPGPAAIPLTPQQTLSEIQQLTITGWYKARTALKKDTTLFSVLNTQMLWEPSSGELNSGQWVWRINTKATDPSAKLMNWFKTTRPVGTPAWVRPGEWVFIAMVWDKAHNSVDFFQGSPTSPVVQVGKTGVRPEAVQALSESAKFKRTLANDSNKLERPFNGSIDDIRCFTKGLDLQAIEKIRQADLSNEALQ